MEHIVIFYNMLANNPFVLQVDSCIGTFKTQGMHGLNLEWMIARHHESNVIPI